MRTVFLSFVAVALLAIGADPAYAQRGRGDDIGLARQGVRPEIETITGTVSDLLIQPCEMTTGRSIVGAHVILTTPDRGELNVHLGPATDLSDLVADVQKGDAVVAEVFRTEKLPAGQVIAKTLDLDGQQYVLRDDTLRPVWAGQGAGRGTGRGMGRGLRGPGGR